MKHFNKTVFALLLTVLLAVMPFAVPAAGNGRNTEANGFIASAAINEQGNYCYTYSVSNAKVRGTYAAYSVSWGDVYLENEYSFYFYTETGALIEDPSNSPVPAAYVIVKNIGGWHYHTDDPFYSELVYTAQMTVSIDGIAFQISPVTMPNDFFIYIDLMGAETAGCTNAEQDQYSKMIQTPQDAADVAEKGAVISPDGETLFSYPAGLKNTLCLIPETVKYIHENAFSGCGGITAVYFPMSVTNVETSAFADCAALTDVYYAGSAEDWAAVEIAEGNDPLLNANMHFSVTDPHPVHTWDEGRITVEPTCETEGETVFTCTACGATRTETIEPLEHLFSEWTEYDRDMHYRYCMNNPDHIETEPHLWMITDIIPSTCIEVGYRTLTCAICDAVIMDYYPAVGHSFGSWTKLNDETHIRVCEYNNDHVETAPHTWTDGSIAAPAGCTTNGEMKYTCTVCGAVRTETIPATGHTDTNDDGICDNGCGTVLRDPDTGNDDNGDTGGTSFWDKLTDFFKRIVDFFRNLFR